MAFRFKDLMIQVVPQGQGGGEDDPVCTLASKEPDPPAIVPCTLASMDPTGVAALVPCTLASMEPPPGIAAQCPEASQAQCTCTLATKMEPAGVVAAAICTLASRYEPRMGALGTITTVTTVTTVTTLVQGGGGRGGDLSSLKAQLRAALEDVERQERAQAEPGLPATVEESDDLERRLREAIEELQEHRKNLQRSDKGAEPRGGGSKGVAKSGAKKATKGRK